MDSLEALSTASNGDEVDVAISSLTPENIISLNKEECEAIIGTLTTILDREEALSLNAKQKRKCKRLIESLKDTEHVKNKTINVDTEGKSQTQDSPSGSFTARSKKLVAAKAYDKALSIEEAVVELNDISNALELEAVLNALSIPQKEEGQDHKDFLSSRDSLKQALNRVLSLELEGMNRLLKRRVTRMQYVLLPSDEKNIKKSAGNGDKRAVSSDMHLSTCISALEDAADAASIEAAIADINTASGGFDDKALRDALCQKLDSLLNNDGEPALQSKLKRRLKRLRETLTASADSTKEAAPLQTSTGRVEEAAVKTVETSSELLATVHNPPPGEPLDPVITALSTVNSISELEMVLKQVKPGSGNHKSRRTLRRAINKLMTDSAQTFLSDMNSKSRRAVQRCLSLLEAKANTGTKMMTLTELEEKGIPVEGNKNIKGLKRALESTESNIPKKQNLHILFVGQLSYSVKEGDLEKHLRANGLRGDVKIRILTDMNGTSKGTAFVECEGATEMYEGLKAHRTILHGRRINVEKSIGGGKDAKRDRLKVQRMEQETAVRDKIDTILKDYESAEVITVEGLGTMLHERFYSYQPTHVQEILSKFASKAKKDRSLPALDALMDEADVQLFGQRKLDQFKQQFTEMEESES